MTYPQALDYLDSFLNYEQIPQYRYPEAFSLERMEGLLRRLGDPHRRYPSLHVAGTKGKGSTCAFAASILSEAGLRTGFYSSPHLHGFRERIRVDGQPISEEELARVVEEVRPAASRELTYFEVTTACAFVHFARRKVDAAVAEVGLGGRLDATNALAPAVTAITPVSLDHMPQLGERVSQIAREKAGIVKAGVPVVLAPQPQPARQVIEEVASRQGAPLHRVEEEVEIREVQLDLSGGSARFQTPVRVYPRLQVPLLGRHQLANAAVALRMAELFAEADPSLRLTEGVVRAGIERTVWPGRCEFFPGLPPTVPLKRGIGGTPPVLLDGAQNASSARALRESVETLLPGRRVWLLVGASTGKDLAGMAAVWGPWADRVLLTRAQVPRSEPVERLAAAFGPLSRSLTSTGSVAEGLRQALEEAGPQGLVVVAGSLFVVAEARAALTRRLAFPLLLGQEQARADRG